MDGGLEADPTACLATAAAESDDDPRGFPGRAGLDPLHDEIAAALQASTMTTVWQRLRDAGRTSASFPSRPAPGAASG